MMKYSLDIFADKLRKRGAALLQYGEGTIFCGCG